MTGVPLALALAAGVLAAVNPCGFALLPAYLSILISGDRGVARALTLTAGMTAGFLAVFGAFGLVLAPAAGALQRHLPWFTIGFGVLLALLGGWLAAGRQLPALPWKPSRAPTLTRSLPSMALFGAAYALASLSCTVGPFLAIVVSSLRAGSTLAGVALFGAYAAGMGLVVGTAAVAVALARASVLRRIRAGAGALSRAGGVLLVVTGAYVAWYGWYEVHAGTRAADPVVRFGSDVQRAFASGLSGLGVGVLAAVFAALVGVGVFRRLRAPTTEEGAPVGTPSSIIAVVSSPTGPSR
jgi:cytochrome c biogenesis protein CcdA